MKFIFFLSRFNINADASGETMALKKENILREQRLLNGEVLTVVWDAESDLFRLAKYYVDTDTFSKGEPYDDKAEAIAAFFNLANKANDAYKLNGDEKFDTFFCESLPDEGKNMGLSNTHTFDNPMTIDEADAYIRENEVINPDNGRPYIRVRFPMLWSDKMGKYVYFEAVN